MAKRRHAPNTAKWRTCGAAALLVAAFAPFADARAETLSGVGGVTANAPGEILEQPAVSGVTTPARPRQESSLTGNPLWEVALSALQETRARPIFSPSRRPPSPPVVAAPPPPIPTPPAPPREPERLKLTLLGTVVGTSHGMGVFVDETSKEIIRMRTGASHDGWTLRSIERRTASFEKDHRETTLMLPSPGSEQPFPSVGVAASGTGGGNISGNDRRPANLAETRAQPIALTLPASPSPAPKMRREIRSDILSVGAN
jgi:hypothetical protein